MALSMLLTAALFMMPDAKRVHHKHEATGVLHPITGPMMQHAPLINTPVVTRQHLQVQPASFPTVSSNQHNAIFPSQLLAANGTVSFEEALKRSKSQESAVPRGVNTIGSATLRDVTTRWNGEGKETVDHEYLVLDDFMGTW